MVQAQNVSIPAQASKVSVNVYDLISLSLNDETNVEIKPEDVAYSTLKTSEVTEVSVTTNVLNGYVLHIADLDSDDIDVIKSQLSCKASYRITWLNFT